MTGQDADDGGWVDDNGEPVDLAEWIRHAHEPPDDVKIATVLKAATFHWYFSQGIRAIDCELYVPGVLALLAGIEASIRFTMTHLATSKLPLDGDLGATLSNPLLLSAIRLGLPVHLLAFPGEEDFLARLGGRQPHVRIVQVRHDLAHGNTREFINFELGKDMAFFTPECLRPVAQLLRQMSLTWAEELAQFRAANIKCDTP